MNELINLLAPKHTRTSCSDTDFEGNAFANELGYPRCERCALLFWNKNKEFPYGANVQSLTVQFDRDHAGLLKVDC